MADRFTDIPPSPAHPLQNLNELGDLWEHVAARPHARVLEIGSLYGGTLWYWSHLPAVEALVSVDLPTTFPGVGVEAAAARAQWAGWFGQRVRFTDFAADSQDPRIAIPAYAALDGQIDFLFIDGDHSYDGVKADFDRWSLYVRSGGTVALHDTWPGSAINHEPGVAAFVEELRRHYPSTQWTDPDGVGICAFTLP